MTEKDQLDLSMLEKEYYDMCEETIPWRRPRGLPAFHPKRVPVGLSNIGFYTFVSAVTDQKTQHIGQMVTYTKRPKKKGKGKRAEVGGNSPSTTDVTSPIGLLLHQLRPTERGRSIWQTKQSRRGQSRGPMSFAMLQKESMKLYQEEIPWRRLGFSSLENLLRSSPGVCQVSGWTVSVVASPAPAKSSRPVPALQELEEKMVERNRLPETRESGWAG